MFLGYWFIRKAMWANEAAVKFNVTSLKKFYDYMLERGEVDREAVEDMKAVLFGRSYAGRRSRTWTNPDPEGILAK